MWDKILLNGSPSDKVNFTKFEWGFISTVRVHDSLKPYETAIQHDRYNNGKLIIVAVWDSLVDAQKGHNKWIEDMSGKLPESLQDVGMAACSLMLDRFSEDNWRNFPLQPIDKVEA